MAHFFSESPTPCKCVRFVFHCVARSLPRPPLSALPSQDGNELCNMMPCSRFPPGLPSSRLTLIPRTCFSRDTILSCLEFNVIRKQFGPHTASMVTWHGLSLPLAGLFLLCIGCARRYLAAQAPGPCLLGIRLGRTQGASDAVCMKPPGSHWSPTSAVSHKRRRLSPLTPAA